MTDAAPSSPRRLVSLDAFRGLTIALMILVNNPGAWGPMYAALRHAAWHGWTVTDLVFPCFLFIVGAAIPFALGRRLEEGVPRGPIVRKIVRRGLTLWALGIGLACLGWFVTEDGLDLAFWRWDWSRVRILGVLPRIGICYAIASILFLTTTRRTQAIVAALTLLVYWPLIALVPNPDVATPPGASPMDAPGTQVGAWLDQTILGEGHLWVGGVVYDPEGIVSTLPAAVTVLLGVFVGRMMRRKEVRETTKVARLLFGGAALTALGLLWGEVFPINNALWTSSYVVFTAGCAMVGLGVCHLLFDVLGWRRLAWPLTVYGVNALTVFVMSAVRAVMLRYRVVWKV